MDQCTFGAEPLARELSEGLGDSVAEGGLVAGAECAEVAENERLLEGGEDRLDGGGLDEAGGLPLAEPDLSWSRTRAELAGDRHHHHFGSGGVVGSVADDGGGPLLRGGLAGEVGYQTFGENPWLTSSLTLGPDTSCSAFLEICRSQICSNRTLPSRTPPLPPPKRKQFYLHLFTFTSVCLRLFWRNPRF